MLDQPGEGAHVEGLVDGDDATDGMLPGVEHGQDRSHRVPHQEGTLDVESAEEGAELGGDVTQAKGRAGAVPVAGKLLGEPDGVVETAPQYVQHGVAGGGHDAALLITRHRHLALVGGQRRLRLVDPAELHKRREPPEQAVSLPDALSRRPGQVDDLGSSRQAVFGGLGVPEGVEAGVEHLGQRSGIPSPSRQRKGLVGKRSPPGPSGGLAQQ